MLQCDRDGVCCRVVVQYQSHYSRHFMPLGEKERQDREVFQRNMKSRMETFKSGRHKRHKKERSLKKVPSDQSHTSSISSSITNNTDTAADDSEDQQDNITDNTERGMLLESAAF